MAKDAVIYTAVFGEKDTVLDLPLQTLECDLVCFTDNPQLNCGPFEKRVVQPLYTDPVRNARMMKILAHRYLSHETTVWMDANVRVRSPDFMQWAFDSVQGSEWAVHKHPKRNSVYAEGQRCIEIAKDAPDVLNRQMQDYRRAGYPLAQGLVMTSILIRRNKSKRVARFNEAWWKEICRYSRRDQMSFNFVAWKRNFQYHCIGASIFKNPHFEIGEHRISDSLMSYQDLLNHKNAEIQELRQALEQHLKHFQQPV